jgi:hypothetical protein
MRQLQLSRLRPVSTTMSDWRNWLRQAICGECGWAPKSSAMIGA